MSAATIGSNRSTRSRSERSEEAVNVTQTIETSDLYRAQFEALSEENKSLPAWLSPLRKAAFSRFAELGFPTRHDEEWRFTNVTPIKETTFARAPEGSDGLTKQRLATLPLGALGACALVFVNGRYAPELSTLRALPNGVRVGSLSEVVAAEPGAVETHLGRHVDISQHAFAALNTAFIEDGAVVLVPRGKVVEEPIHLLFVSTGSDTPTVSHPRTLIVAGENSQATIVESYVGATGSTYFTNAVTEVVAEPNAVIDHVKLNRESEKAYHIGVMHVQMARSSNFTSHAVTLGGAITRNEVTAVLDGEGIECTLNGVYLANGSRLIDNHTAIDHAKANCASHEVYKGILDDKARGVFNGKIFVRQDAQKTDAKQSNMTLLLSDDAQINTKPQLEIFADDVKCTHGATVGQLDPEQLFYLRARGIGEKEARSLLIRAFAGDIIDRIKIEPVRIQVEEMLYALLPQEPVE